MIVGVVGSRSFGNYVLMEKTLDTLVWEGVAVSISKMVRRALMLLPNPMQSFVIFPSKSSTRIGTLTAEPRDPLRNRQIVKASDLIVAFWDGKSLGTRSTKGLTEKAGKPFLHVKI